MLKNWEKKLFILNSSTKIFNLKSEGVNKHEYVSKKRAKKE